MKSVYLRNHYPDSLKPVSGSTVFREDYTDNSEPIRGETELKEIKIINEDISN